MKKSKYSCNIEISLSRCMPNIRGRVKETRKYKDWSQVIEYKDTLIDALQTFLVHAKNDNIFIISMEKYYPEIDTTLKSGYVFTMTMFSALKQEPLVLVIGKAQELFDDIRYQRSQIK